MDDKKDFLILPAIDGMIDDALNTLQAEITRYKTKVARGQALNPTEAKIMQGYIKSLVELSKEERDRAKEADLSDLSMEDLMALMGKQNKKALPSGDND